MAPKAKYSLKEYCENFGHEDFLKLWDYEKNRYTPEEVAYKSKKYVYIKCPKGIHESRAIVLLGIIKAYENGKSYCLCNQCNSIGQYIIDTYGEDFYNKIVSDKNEKSLFDISRRGRDIIWLKCQNDETHPDYDLPALNFVNSFNCPYCAGKRVCETNSLGYIYPQVLDIWSDKNDKTPYDYTYGSGKEVWLKCENGKHDDYLRQIDRSVMYDFRCPKCGRENQHALSGPEHPNWKGGITPELKLLRRTPEYLAWRSAVYERDNYTCQCCGAYGKRLQAHHIEDFVSHEDKRYDVLNGATLCFDCHDTTVKGSFHNLYGTHYKTPEELEEYINNRRKELGITIPFSIDDYLAGNILKPGDVWNDAMYQCWSFNNNRVRPESKHIKMKPISRTK